MVSPTLSLLCAWMAMASHVTSAFPMSYTSTGLRQDAGRLLALSDDYLENDLVAIRFPSIDMPRLCVVREGGAIEPLCQHEDDEEFDLFVDPRNPTDFWESVTDDDVAGTYGEGWYGQRPVPSLGGGPGYGAEANEIWTIDADVLEQLEVDGVNLPILDVGMAHGEKARGGAM